MANSTPTKLLQQVPRFDGTNLESWSFSTKAVLLFLNALGIAQGTETAPTEAAKLEDYEKRSRQGLSLILVSVDPAVQQSLDMDKTLKENWANLVARYGARTGLNIWVDFTKYTSTHFSTESPLMQQIDALSELCTHIHASSILITDSLRLIILLKSLPDSYEVVQQMLLATIDFNKVNPKVIDNICSRIMSEEARQALSPSMSAIKKATAKIKCQYCGGLGHSEKDCY